MGINSKKFCHSNSHKKVGNPYLICICVCLLILLGQVKTWIELCFSVWRNIFIWWILYIFSGAVASMFWVDAELGVDIYLDGKLNIEFCFQVKCYYG